MAENKDTVQVFPSPSLDILGYIRSPYVEKFGIPRQAGLAGSVRSTIVLSYPFNRQEMIHGLELFSHLWIIFFFHQAHKEGWKPTVRPPRLGGQKRIGVFASRSPHRPNHIGISAVKIEQIIYRDKETCIEVSGADLVDGTPVLDIKPYLAYCDSIVEAVDGYSGDILAPLQSVRFSSQAEQFCLHYQKETGRNLMEILLEILKNDPRPASQKTKKQHFGMSLWNVNILWRVENGSAEVTECHLIEN